MVLEDEKTAAIVRATVMAELTPFLDRSNVDLLQNGFFDPDPMVRRQATLALDGIGLQDTHLILIDMLSDSSLIVRTVAAELLSPIEAQIASDPDGAGRLFRKALAEYISIQRVHADRPESHVNLGSLATRRGKIEEAVEYFKEALRRTPSFGPASVNLADALRTLDRDAEGIVVLRKAIEKVADDAGLHHALGLALVRVGEKKDALPSLKQAVQLSPESPRYALVHAVALKDSGETQLAIEALQAALLIHPDDRWLKGAVEEYRSELKEPEED
jgi:tetratricopeptide (TPR) repeat protein